MYRTRFKNDIVAEFLPPSREGKRQKVIILCDGMPSIPSKQALVEFLSKKGYWVFYPRWRGAWESGGQFLQKSPEEDILDVIGELPKGVQETAFGQQFTVSADEIFVIGGSFGGAAAILSSLDERVKKVVANCPVVDWTILDEEQEKETSNPSYPAYIREAFGNGYRLSEKNWNKLRGGVFFNPMHHVDEIDGTNIMMFHAKDDPYVPWKTVDSETDRREAYVAVYGRSPEHDEYCAEILGADIGILRVVKAEPSTVIDVVGAEEDSARCISLRRTFRHLRACPVLGEAEGHPSREARHPVRPAGVVRLRWQRTRAGRRPCPTSSPHAIF